MRLAINLALLGVMIITGTFGLIALFGESESLVVCVLSKPIGAMLLYATYRMNEYLGKSFTVTNNKVIENGTTTDDADRESAEPR